MLSFLYDSGIDGHYPSESMRKVAGLSILVKSTNQVSVVDGNINKDRHQVRLPFEGLQPKVNKSDTFKQFDGSLFNVGKVNNNSNISIFTLDGVIVHKKEYALITCKDRHILVGIRDHTGRYRIPLIQQQDT